MAHHAHSTKKRVKRLQDRNRKGTPTAGPRTKRRVAQASSLHPQPPIRNSTSTAEPFQEGDVVHVNFAGGIWRGRLEHDGTVVREIDSVSILIVAYSVLDAAKQRMKEQSEPRP